jgi:hypothetical protein
MEEQAAKDADKFDVASVEAKLFEPLTGFYEKVTILLQKSSLDTEKATVVIERIKLVMRNVVDEQKRTKSMNMAGPLDSAYEELRCLIEELSGKGEQ